MSDLLALKDLSKTLHLLLFPPNMPSQVKKVFQKLKNKNSRFQLIYMTSPKSKRQQVHHEDFNSSFLDGVQFPFSSCQGLFPGLLCSNGALPQSQSLFIKSRNQLSKILKIQLSYQTRWWIVGVHKSNSSYRTLQRVQEWSSQVSIKCSFLGFGYSGS